MESQPSTVNGGIYVDIIAKWSGKDFHLRVRLDETVGDLKKSLYGMTLVSPERQTKLIGLFPNNKTLPDETPLSALGLKPNKKFMMIGTPDDQILKEPDPSELPDVVNDFDIDYGLDEEEPRLNPDNRKKLERIIKEREVIVMNPPRPGKKLLVLDLDYTLMDVGSMKNAMTVAEVRRPYLEEFMTAVYPKYDIAFWSQTSWKWIEIKLTELNLLTNPNFCVSFVLDRTFMFPIASRKDGKSHEVKPLEVIWAKFPNYYNQKNTVHIDDLSRNFAMNPLNGIKVKAFKNCNETKQYDTELFHLTKYLLKIADLGDVTSVTHKKWKKSVKHSNE